MNIVDLAILKKMVSGGGGSGTDNYNDLSNLPQINGETLAGNKTAENLGLQDALTFDSEPTEDSTNPVESGGVYYELAKKQDNLTFDGTYDASTNKAATESTVTDAINELDVSETSFDADETIDTISETDGKINVTKKDIAIASNQVTSMTGYTKPSSAPANPAIQTSDTANQAFGKLEFKADTNQSNILYGLSRVGKNILNYDAWKTVGVNGGTAVWENNGVTLTATSSDCYTYYAPSGSFPDDAKISVNEGDKIVLSWEFERASSSITGSVFIFPDGNVSGSTNTSVTTKSLEYTVPSGVSFLTFRFGVNSGSGSVLKYKDIMICYKNVADVLGTAYELPALPNYDLTRMMTPFFTVPINHNMIYRGQNLGDTLTADQDTALSSGNFTDLYLGDYWTKQITIPAFYEVTAAEPADWSTNYTSYYTKSGDTYTPVTGDTAPTWAANTYYERLVPSQTVTLKAVIADFDTFYAGYASGYAAINSHHAAVVVHGFNNVVWNKTNTTAGGYVNSLIHKWLVGSALPQIETWFGSAKVLSHQKLLTNAITGDAASGWAWSSQKISLLSENQMYGSKVWGNSKAANGGYEPGEAFKHLNVFNHIDVNLLFGNKNIWLRDIASAGRAAHLSHGGSADGNVASSTWIAPAALILLS